MVLEEIQNILSSYPNGIGFFVVAGIVFLMFLIITIIWNVIIPLFEKDKKEVIV